MSYFSSRKLVTCCLSLVLCARFLLFVVVTNSSGRGVPGAEASIASGDAYSEDLTNGRGVAMLETCQTKQGYLRIEFGSVVKTLMVTGAKGDGVLRVTLDVKQLFGPMIFDQREMTHDR